MKGPERNRREGRDFFRDLAERDLGFEEGEHHDDSGHRDLDIRRRQREDENLAKMAARCAGQGLVRLGVWG